MFFKSKKVKQVSSYEIELTGEHLLKLVDLPEDATNVRIFVKIPRGGDYSGMDLDVTETPITITYDTKFYLETIEDE